jgi:hypothetical protein
LSEEVTVKVRMPLWIVREAERRKIDPDKIAKAAVKLAILEDILGKHGLEEEDLEWILEKRKQQS